MKLWPTELIFFKEKKNLKAMEAKKQDVGKIGNIGMLRSISSASAVEKVEKVEKFHLEKYWLSFGADFNKSLRCLYFLSKNVNKPDKEFSFPEASEYGSVEELCKFLKSEDLPEMVRQLDKIRGQALKEQEDRALRKKLAEEKVKEDHKKERERLKDMTADARRRELTYWTIKKMKQCVVYPDLKIHGQKAEMIQNIVDYEVKKQIIKKE